MSNNIDTGDTHFDKLLAYTPIQKTLIISHYRLNPKIPP